MSPGHSAFLRYLLQLPCMALVLMVIAPVVAVDSTFTIDEQQSSLTIDASTVFIVPVSDSDTQPLGGTIDVSFDFGTSGAFPQYANFTINQSAVSPLNPFSLTLGAPPFFGVSVIITDAVANTTTPHPPIMLDGVPGPDLVYEFDASELDFTLDQGIVSISGLANETIDLSTSPVTGSAPAGTIGKLWLTPGSTVGAFTAVDAVLEMPISFSQDVDLDGQVVTLDVDGIVIANSSFHVALAGLAADFNNDNIVDGADLSIWEISFGVNQNADANDDGYSDGADFLIWQHQFGSGVNPPIQAVPEPGSLLLATLAGSFLTSRQQRRA